MTVEYKENREGIQNDNAPHWGGTLILICGEGGIRTHGTV
jgi:hypothetical protein